MIAAGNPAVFIRTIGIMLIDFSKNHFELFGLPASFQLDITQLEQAYRQLQAQVHPDNTHTWAKQKNAWHCNGPPRPTMPTRHCASRWPGRVICCS